MTIPIDFDSFGYLQMIGYHPTMNDLPFHIFSTEPRKQDSLIQKMMTNVDHVLMDKVFFQMNSVEFAVLEKAFFKMDFVEFALMEKELFQRMPTNADHALMDKCLIQSRIFALSHRNFLTEANAE